MADKSNPKGRVLEDAVEAIERAILETDPEMANRTIRLQARKRIVVQDVTHVIDLWVELAGPKGYDSVFVFECKNWGDDVTKDEVVLFSEKIRASGAQCGFIVAREFNKGARAQAKQDPRVRLLEVREEEYARLQPPVSLHYVMNEIFEVEAQLGVGDEDFAGRAVAFDFDRAVAVLDGKQINLVEYLDAWRATIAEEAVGRFPTIKSPTGTYTTVGEGARTFARGALVVDGLGIASVRLKVTATFRVAWPAMVSSIEVVGRGRVLALEPISVPGGGEIHSRLVGVAQEAEPEAPPPAPSSPRKPGP